MLWAKKLEQCQAALTAELKKFLATRIKTVKPEDVSQDIMKTAVKLDMSRSAARLRRRLYAQWQRWDLCEGEVVRLGPTGVELRPGWKDKDPDELGDLFVDPFRIISVVKMLGLGGPARLSNTDRIKGVATVLNTIIKQTRHKSGPLADRTVVVLMALHAVEANREVPKAKVADTVSRHCGQWGVPLPDARELATDLETLTRHGALTDAGESYRLNDRMGYPW